MRAERWQEVDALFAEALELAPEDREGFLDRACEANGEVRRIVEGLLAADEKARTFLERPAAVALSGGEAAHAAGSSFGSYRLERLISHGGMGVVYVASRDDGQFERRVAVKLLRQGVINPRVLERFRAERQILARLEHPSIARLYDGGESEQGVPFLVMEYVEGQPLDVYCDERRLSIDERLRLFGRLFEALAYAHQNLLVHGDIKPANVLVTAEGELKLIDFGIAERLTDGHADGVAARASADLRAMTPGYASPEQVRGEAITTASDVYALGVVLHELLSGSRPVRSRGAERPVPPSRTLGRALDPDREANDGERLQALCRVRRTRPGALRRKLSGDLDAIVCKALEEDPRRRYSSVAEVAADVERHLGGWPVSARPQTLGTRAGKFVRRYRSLVTLSAVALGLVLALLASLHLQRNRAGHERDKAREALAFLVSVFEQADPYQRGAENIPARDVLEAGATRVSRELSGDPEVQAALLTAIGRASAGLRQLDDAAPLLERAVALRRESAPDSLALAESLDQLAWLRFLSSDFEASEALYREALDLRWRLLGRDAPKVAETLNALGTVLGERSQSFDGQTSHEIEGLHREALRIYQKAEGPEGLGVAHTLFRLAKMMMDRGDTDQAKTLSRENVRINILCQGEAHPDTAMALRLLALILIERGELDEAQDALGRALEAQRQTLPPDHPDILLTLNDLALLHGRKGDYAEAEARYREALDAYLAVYGEKHAHTAVVMSNLASTLLVRGRFDEAVALHERALATKLEVFGERHVFVTESLNALARGYAALGRYPEALERARRSLAISREIVGTEHPVYAKALCAVGLVLHRQGESAAAEPYLRQGLELFRTTQPEGHFRTARAEVLLGSCLTALGRFEEAEPLLRQGYDTLAARFTPEHVYVREARDELAALERAKGIDGLLVDG